MLVFSALIVVILLALVGWTVTMERPPGPDGAGEALDGLAAEWAEGLPDVGSGGQGHRETAEEAAVADRPVVAWLALREAVVADPADLDAWLMIACVSARGGVPGAPDLQQAGRIVDAVAVRRPDHAGLPAARAWQLLAADQPEEALVALAGADDLEAQWARWEALTRLPDRWDEAQAAGQSLLELEPGHVPACVGVARAWIGAADPAAAWAVVERCRGAGLDDPRLPRLQGDILDSLGQFEPARRAWLEGGAVVHAAAVARQEQLAATEAPLLEPGPPPVLLHGLWAALVDGDAEPVAVAATAIREAGLAGPEFRLALGAAAMLDGAPRAALDQLGDDRSAEGWAVRARALAALSDRTAAARAFGEARASARWELAPWREELAWLARVDREAARQLVDEAARLDLVAAGLALDDRNRDRPWLALCPSPWPVHQLDARSAALVAGLAGEPEAGRRLDAVLEADPSDAQAWTLRAWTALRRDEDAPAAARAAARRAASLAPDEAVAHLLDALASLRLGDLDAADEALVRARACPEAPAIGLGLVAARLALARGAPDAVDKVAEVVAVAPDTSGLLRLAWRANGGSAAVLARPLGGPRGWALDG